MSALRTILVFVHPQCPHSRALAEDFRRRGVVFAEISLTEASGLQQFREVCWERRLPVVLDHERLSIGFGGKSSSFDELGIDAD